MKKQIYQIKENRFLVYKYYKSKSQKARAVVFLHGLMSDMNGSKAKEIGDFCQKEDISYMVFDNYGHGESSGVFTDENIESWYLGAKELIEHVLKSDDLILIGSSAGAWTALLLALKMKNVQAVMTLAAAPDFTKYIVSEMSVLDKKEFETDGYVMQRGITMTKSLLLHDPKYYLLKDKIAFNKPVCLIHGYKDEIVDYKMSECLFKQIESNNIVLKLIKDGEHKLSRPQDLEVIKNSIAELITIVT